MRETIRVCDSARERERGCSRKRVFERECEETDEREPNRAQGQYSEFKLSNGIKDLGRAQNSSFRGP